MVFYKIEANRIRNGEVCELSRQEQRAIASELAEKTESLFQKSDQRNMIFTTSLKDATIVFGGILQTGENIDKLFQEYRNTIPFEVEDPKIEEVTFNALQAMLSSACRNDYIGDDDEVLMSFGISELSSHIGPEFGEALIDKENDISKIKKTVDDMLFSKTMLPEIERIYEKENVNNILGHPVHYIVQADDRNIRKTVYKLLLLALYNNGRLKNRRYTFIDFNERSRFPGATFNSIYKSSTGGAVVVRFTSDAGEGDEFGNRARGVIAAICDIATRYKQKVLTIICLPKTAKSARDVFLMNWGNTAFVELHEDVVSSAKAAAYLKTRAKENNVSADKKLTTLIDEEKSYTATELNEVFDSWFQQKLCNEIYPQYKTAETVKTKLKQEEPRGSSYDRLQKLIGLKNAKEVMNQALNYFKIQKMFADKGLKNERPSMHMLFTGNPGTAKTTVARLFAEIMKENELLSNGEIIEVGRADLVGEYVGHTAPLVKAAFAKAKGGVLFIDEAYSLVDGRSGMFGDEAINTIVQEMENNRKDTIVIFAGYPDKMEEFLNKNPGLRSRIAFHVPFDDYNSEELCEIAQLIAGEKGFKIEEGAIEKLANCFEIASKRSDFGNGRYARNIIEK